MRVVWGEQEFEAVTPASQRMRLSDVAALQRETGWKMAQVQEMGQLEVVAAQMVVFFTLRANGRLVSFEKAGTILDEVEFVPDAGDEPEVVEDENPT